MRKWWLGLLLLVSASLYAQDSACENCSNAAPPNPSVDAAAASAADIQTKLDDQYCAALNKCGYGSGQYLSSYPAEHITRRGCGLDRTELATVRSYGGGGYADMNRHLWGVKLNPACPTVIERMNRALGRLPRFEGVVWRGTSLPPAVREQHAVGATVTYPAFTSSSTSRALASSFAGGQDMFMIFSRAGRPIMGLTAFDHEKEVLFASGTQFKVLRRTNTGHLTNYVMIELVPGESAASLRTREAAALARANRPLPEEQDNPPPDFEWRCPKDPSEAVPPVIREPQTSP